MDKRKVACGQLGGLASAKSRLGSLTKEEKSLIMSNVRRKGIVEKMKIDIQNKSVQNVIIQF